MIIQNSLLQAYHLAISDIQELANVVIISKFLHCRLIAWHLPLIFLHLYKAFITSLNLKGNAGFEQASMSKIQGVFKDF